jgi:hypothetical protein
VEPVKVVVNDAAVVWALGPSVEVAGMESFIGGRECEAKSTAMRSSVS